MKILLPACLLFLAIGLTGCPDSGPKPDAKYEKKETTAEEFNMKRNESSSQNEAPPT